MNDPCSLRNSVFSAVYHFESKVEQRLFLIILYAILNDCPKGLFNTCQFKSLDTSFCQAFLDLLSALIRSTYFLKELTFTLKFSILHY